MSDDGPERTTEAPWTGRQTALFVLLVGGGFFVWLVWLGTSPIPTGKENRGKARGFLKELFPNHTVSPPQSVTAPVATVFHLIRSGEPAVAKRAIEFAAEQRFGYATPYVIGRSTAATRRCSMRHRSSCARSRVPTTDRAPSPGKRGGATHRERCLAL